MAKQKNLIYVGSKGGLVYYSLNGNYIIRSKPAFVKQTTATRASAARFGFSVRTAKYLRRALASVLPVANNMQVVHRFNRVVYEWLEDYSNHKCDGLAAVDLFRRFSFTEDITLADRLKLPLTLTQKKDGKTAISFGAVLAWRDFVKPVNAVSVQLTIAVACCTMPECLVRSVYDTVIHVYADGKDYNVGEMVLPFKIPPNSMVITAGALKYFGSSNRKSSGLNGAAWMPAGIMDAMYIPVSDNHPLLVQTSQLHGSL